MVDSVGGLVEAVGTGHLGIKGAFSYVSNFIRVSQTSTIDDHVKGVEELD